MSILGFCWKVALVQKGLREKGVLNKIK